jgi:hypothetical protein
MTPDGEPVGDARHVQGANHFHLLNHPRVYEHLKTWLAGAESAEPAVLSFNA